MTIADLFSMAGDGIAAVGRIPVDNVLWLAGAFLFICLVGGAVSLILK